MRAVKSNQEYVVTEETKDAYVKEGFDIYDDDGKILEHGKGKVASQKEYERVCEELREAKKSTLADSELLPILQNRGGYRDQEGGFYKIASVENNTMTLKRFNGTNSRYTIEISLDTRLNNLLFAPDIKKWEEIKYMEYEHYIHQQLEMFNFIEMNS